MVPYFFHLIQRLILHLPQYKESKLTIKNNVKNILININNYKNYIINKYFFNYFNKTFLENSPFKDRN